MEDVEEEEMEKEVELYIPGSFNFGMVLHVRCQVQVLPICLVLLVYSGHQENPPTIIQGSAWIL